MNMFFPPEGAMQFKVYPKGATGLRPVIPAKMPRRPDWIWVQQPVPNIRTTCPCKEVYPVIVEGFDEDLRRAAYEGMKGFAGYPVVCLCQGEVIE